MSLRSESRKNLGVLNNEIGEGKVETNQKDFTIQKPMTLTPTEGRE